MSGRGVFGFPRWLHKLYADWMGYFWMRCRLCNEHFGGHEWKWKDPNGSIYYEMDKKVAVCPRCHNAAALYNKHWEDAVMQSPSGLRPPATYEGSTNERKCIE